MSGARLPFDPGKMRPAPDGDDVRTEGGGAPVRVGDLARLIGAALRKGLPTKMRVVGEVSGFRDRTHWYFDLKDEDAVISCVMFAKDARRVGSLIENGQQVVVTGRVDFFEKQGRTQVYAEAIEPVGAGPLEVRFRKLVAELRELGWFDPARKRKLPVFPRRIAVVTSRTGAALQDVLVTAGRRCAAVEIAVVDVRVQGDGSAGEVSRAIDWLSREHERMGIDAVLVTRGGGSMEDLWAFNERVVAEAILKCAVPVVAAIGHETDVTIAELVADERCATPTQAAMRLTPDKEALAEQISQMRARTRAMVSRRIEHEERRLLAARKRRAMSAPLMVIERAFERMVRTGCDVRDAVMSRLTDERVCVSESRTRLARVRPEAALAARGEVITARRAELARALAHRVEMSGARVREARAVLAAVGPMEVLGRGYSVTLGADGRVMRSAGDAETGERIVTVLADGRVRSVVEPPPVTTEGTERRKGKKPRDRQGQMGLF